MRARWWVFLGAVVACVIALAWAAASGPDPFPTHWGGGTRPDRWEPKGAALAQLSGVAAVLAVVFGGFAAFVPKLPERLINTPRRDYWFSKQGRPQLDAILQRSMLGIGSAVLLLLAFSVVGSVVAPDGGPIHAAVMWLVIAGILGGVVHLVWRLANPPGDSRKR